MSLVEMGVSLRSYICRSYPEQRCSFAGVIDGPSRIGARRQPGRETTGDDETTGLRALIEKEAPDADLLREMIGFAAQRLAELEVVLARMVLGPMGAKLGWRVGGAANGSAPSPRDAASPA